MFKRILLYFLLLTNLGITVWLWWQGSSSLFITGQAGVLVAIGRLFGLLAELFILLQLLLMGRVPWIERVFGHDRLNRLHRWVGYGLALFFVSHPVLITWGYSSAAGAGFWTQFWIFLTQWEDALKAAIALVLLLIIIAVSLPAIRRRLRYETWYFTHLLVYVAIILVIGHQVNTADVSTASGIAYWYTLNFTVLGLILVFRWLRPPYLYWHHRFAVSRVVQENRDVVSIYITGQDLFKFKFKAGQFANLTFLRRGLWFTHPFSFSTAPNGKYLRFSVKQLGDFTSKAHLITPGTAVIIDGPLGLFTTDIAAKDKFLLIAGGIGITPLRALAETLTEQSQDTVLLYGARTPQDFVFQDELKEFGHRSHLVISEVAEKASPGFEQGYIDRDKITRLVPDFLEREVYLCGPVPMMNAVLQTLLALGIPRQQIHYEKFSY